MDRGSKSKRKSDFTNTFEPTVSEFIKERSEDGVFALKQDDVALVEELTKPFFINNPEIVPVWTDLVKDPNVSNSIFQNPSFRKLMEGMKAEPTITNATQIFLTEGEDFEQIDEIDDKDDDLTSTSSATASMSKRSPWSSVSCRGPDDVYDSDDDDLGYSRTTHLGDYPNDDDPQDEGDSSDDVDLERTGSDHCCPHCGTRSDHSSPNAIPIPRSNPPKNVKRNRSTSTTSFGAGSPPQFLASCPSNEQDHFAKISLGFVSLAVVVALVHYMGSSKMAKDLISKSLPWLLDQVNQIHH